MRKISKACLKNAMLQVLVTKFHKTGIVMRFKYP